MPKPRTFTYEEVERLRTALAQAPEKPKVPPPLSAREMVVAIRSEILDLQKRGYTLEEIAELIRKDLNLDTLGVSTLKQYLQKKRKTATKKNAPPQLQHTETNEHTSTGANEFRAALHRHFSEAQAKGESHVEIRSGDLHTEVGGYPGQDHRMPVCCTVMRREMQNGDEVIKEPPSGYGASLIIRYTVPRTSSNKETEKAQV